MLARDTHDPLQPLVCSPIDAANYIGNLTDQMAEIADKSGHMTLSYLLRMAGLEARHLAQVPLRKINRG